MGGGYKPPVGDSVEPIAAAIRDARRQLREVQRPTGTRLASLVAQVQALVAQVKDTLVNIHNTVVSEVNSYLSGGTVSMGTINASGDVSAGGRVTSAAAVRSPGSYSYQVAGPNYKTAWIDPNGTIGFSPSTRRVKKDLQVFPDDLADATLALTPYLGRYNWDGEDTPLKVFLIAEDVAEAGYGPDVVPVDGEGNPETVNSSQLVPALLALIKRLDARVTELESRA